MSPGSVLVLAATCPAPHMTPDPLFERLQRVLLPDYRLERELARGGMGIVFLAHDVTLNCPVAVKLLRPELDTAHTAAAFTREAQILGRVRHPNIATIHQAFSRDGLHYYIMEFIEGPTLAERLDGGPLSSKEGVKLGRDLLDGLESVHRAGVIHRDVKPSNVFVLPGRALLADFGIARAPTKEPRQRHQRSADSDAGTPGYMAPEQIAGDAVTPRTDLYLAAMVIYEAITGRRFPPYTEKPSWTGVPGAIARVLRRATRDDPIERWPDARAFRQALWRTRVRRYLVRAAMLAIGGIVVGVALTGGLLRPAAASPGTLALALPQFDYIGAPAQAPIADSLTELLRAELRSHPDFRALPRSPLGLARFLEAEHLVAAGQWENAYRAYVLAEATDSTCWLCSWRLNDVERWLSREHDPARVQRYLSHVDSFPAWYQSLIRAQQVPLAARLDTLRTETERWGDFFLGYMQLGDELFHRGPLAGHARAEAINAFDRATTLRPDFAPAWEHLAWVDIAEGDSAGAARALAALDRRNVGDDPFAITLRALLSVGFAFRFLPEPAAVDSLRAALRDSVARASPDLGAGPRMLGSFDAPNGEVVFGAMLAANPARNLQRSGLIAQTLGSLALGRPMKALALAQHLADVSPEASITRFRADLETTIALLDPAGIPVRPRVSRAASHDPPNTLFASTISHISRAEQRARQGDIDDARRALLWHEHTDLVGVPTGLPQAAEVDWAFGTLARWRLGRLLDTRGDRAPACEAYRAVIRLWSDGEPLYRARADTARMRVRALGCR